MDVGELLDYKVLFNYLLSSIDYNTMFQPPQAIKRPVDGEDDEDDNKTRKMRKNARAKANRMAKAPSPTPSMQALDQISEEERAEILKFVETEQAQVSIDAFKCVFFKNSTVL